MILFLLHPPPFPPPSPNLLFLLLFFSFSSSSFFLLHAIFKNRDPYSIYKNLFLTNIISLFAHRSSFVLSRILDGVTCLSFFPLDMSPGKGSKEIIGSNFLLFRHCFTHRDNKLIKFTDMEALCDFFSIGAPIYKITNLYSMSFRLNEKNTVREDYLLL